MSRPERVVCGWWVGVWPVGKCVAGRLTTALACVGVKALAECGGSLGRSWQGTCDIGVEEPWFEKQWVGLRYLKGWGLCVVELRWPAGKSFPHA